jgi:hypothetical protein
MSWSLNPISTLTGLDPCLVSGPSARRDDPARVSGQVRRAVPCFVSCCHDGIALLRRGLLAAARPLLPHGRPPRRDRTDPLPQAGRLARLLVGAERSPLPDRGLRGAIDHPPTRAAAPSASLGAARPGGRPGAGRPGRLATRAHRYL